jgi:hypothetical protein
MRKKLKPVITLLLFSLTIGGVSGQDRDKIRDYLRQRFQSYIETTPWQEIYIHTDREEYISGEELWFNVYAFDRQSFMPATISRIVYFELLNAKGRPVAQKRILLDKGSGPGSIHLPDTLTSGEYTIRAYTNWMKNFLPDNCFKKDINIYNAINNKKFNEKLASGKTALKGNLTGTSFMRANSGITMKVNDLKPDVLEITVSANEIYRRENGNLFSLFIQTHGIIDRISSETISRENTEITIPRKSLTPGISQITIFDSKARPVCERYIFNPAAEYRTINLQSPDTIATREKYSLDIDLNESPAKAINTANFSISVAPATANNSVDLDDYLIFGSEFGIIPERLLASGKIREIPKETIDSLLLNVNSSWINWERILSDTIPNFKYRAEKESHFFYGKLLSNNQSATVSSEYVLLCMPGREPGFQYAKTDEEGNFTFNVHIDEDLKDFVMMPDDALASHRIIIESSFAEGDTPSETSVDSTVKSAPLYISDWGVNYQVRKIYGITDIGDTIGPKALPLKPVRFYGKPDQELVMADYVILPEMKEVFFELLPHVSMKKKNSGYEIMINDRIYDDRYELLPDLFLDGVKINNASIIADLDPAIVERIDIVREKYLIGKYSFPGIINVITKSADFTIVPLPDYMIRLPYRVIEPVRRFVIPDHSSGVMKNSAIPDFRNTLYWNPSVKPGIDGRVTVEFRTSDIVSDYTLNLQGITPDGKLISARKNFKVN